LDGGTGVNIMTGGAGNDRYYVDHANDVIVESSGIGSDTLDIVYASVNYTLALGLGLNASMQML
jgi:serralysin